MEDKTELSLSQVLALLEGIKASTYALANTTGDDEHQVVFSAVAGFANVLIELLKHLAEVDEVDIG